MSVQVNVDLANVILALGFSVVVIMLFRWIISEGHRHD